MNGAFLHDFSDDQRELLIGGVMERLSSHGIEDLKNGEIMISGSPSHFVISVRGREYRGRVGVRTFDSDLKFLLDRFAHWLTEIDRQAREASGRRPRKTMIDAHLRPGYRALMAARCDGIDSDGWNSLMEDVLHLPPSMLVAVQHAVKQGAWRRANDPVKCVTETAEREARRMGLSGKPAVPKVQ